LGLQHSFHHKEGQAREEMISRRTSLDEGALRLRPHSLDGVGVSAGDGVFEVLGMVNGEMCVNMFSFN
jgi:hypothetical protein